MKINPLRTDSKPTEQRPIVLDVSRLIWRGWTRRLPTGIDRVCLAYLDRFNSRSLAMIQRGPRRLVLDPRASDTLFALLRQGGPNYRRRMLTQLAFAPARQAKKPLAGKIYLNVGHTGLDADGLPGWLRKQGLRPVFLIHDLIPITHPEFCREGEALRHTRRIHHVLDCAAGVITNSADTGEDLANFAAASMRKMPPVTVAWLGVDQCKENSLPADVGRPYFLVIGTIEARKNHLMLLRLWEELARGRAGEPPMLVLAGQRGWEADKTFELLDSSPLLKGNVRELSGCSDEQLMGLLDGARALLMPSLAEGYGLPVVEALKRGVPVIASDLRVFREIAGDIPLYLDPADQTAWAIAIRDFLDESDERRRQLAAMQSYQAPDWNIHFARVEAYLAEHVTPACASIT